MWNDNGKRADRRDTRPYLQPRPCTLVNPRQTLSGSGTGMSRQGAMPSVGRWPRLLTLPAGGLEVKSMPRKGLRAQHEVHDQRDRKGQFWRRPIFAKNDFSRRETQFGSCLSFNVQTVPWRRRLLGAGGGWWEQAPRPLGQEPTWSKETPAANEPHFLRGGAAWLPAEVCTEEPRRAGGRLLRHHVA